MGGRGGRAGGGGWRAHASGAAAAGEAGTAGFEAVDRRRRFAGRSTDGGDGPPRESGHDSRGDGSGIASCGGIATSSRSSSSSPLLPGGCRQRCGTPRRRAGAAAVLPARGGHTPSPRGAARGPDCFAAPLMRAAAAQPQRGGGERGGGRLTPGVCPARADGCGGGRRPRQRRWNRQKKMGSGTPSGHRGLAGVDPLLSLRDHDGGETTAQG